MGARAGAPLSGGFPTGGASASSFLGLVRKLHQSHSAVHTCSHPSGPELGLSWRRAEAPQVLLPRHIWQMLSLKVWQSGASLGPRGLGGSPAPPSSATLSQPAGQEGGQVFIQSLLPERRFGCGPQPSFHGQVWFREWSLGMTVGSQTLSQLEGMRGSHWLQSRELELESAAFLSPT